MLPMKLDILFGGLLLGGSNAEKCSEDKNKS